MFRDYQNTEELTQSLIDAGCSEETIDSFLSCMRRGDKAEGLCRLEEQRAELLDKIHNDRSCIEFLDNMLHSLRVQSE